jgi:hypothetical protein
MKNIFISYASEDKAVAEKLAKLLESRNYNVWWDHYLIPGQDYRKSIASQLETANKVLVIWSSHSIHSPFVIDEAQRGNKDGKLIPVVIDVSDPPMGFGHLHAVLSKDIDAEFERILSAVEGRAPMSAGGVKRIVSRQRLIITALAAALFLVAVGFAGYFLWDKWTMLGGLDPTLDYRRFRSSRMGLEFVYPQAHLTADTTQEDKGIIRLMSPERNVEALLRRTKLPEHSNVRVGRDIEEKKLRELGYSINYLGPREEANWSNWYIVSGTKPDGTEYYYKRWYTNKDVVSIDFDYPKELIPLYDKIIEVMMSEKRFRID